jgi:RND family efflux transporter MFP subunit
MIGATAMKHSFLFATIGLVTAALAGCAEEQARTKDLEPPKVEVSLPVTDTVSDFEAFTGRFEAIYSITVNARVTGYLDKVNFEDGTEVEKDAVLFEIDPRPYQNEVNRTEATVVQAEARLRRLEADQRRATNLFSRSAIGREEFDRVIGDSSEADAAVGVAKAARDMAHLSLEFTKVKSPIAGRLSRRLVDPGNLVKADETALTNIVSLDPLYVYFEVDERTLLKLRRLVREGKVKSRAQGAVIPILLGLADELDPETGEFLFPHTGEIDFSDNKVDPGTGTLQLRGKIANPKAPSGNRVLSPGLFAHVRLPVGDPHHAILVPQQALARDQGQRVVYVVQKAKNTKGKMVDMVFKRRVDVRPYDKGMMIIEKGLKPGERVVVTGLQRIREEMEVRAVPAQAPVQVSAAKSETAGE